MKTFVLLVVSAAAALDKFRKFLSGIPLPPIVGGNFLRWNVFVAVAFSIVAMCRAGAETRG